MTISSYYLGKPGAMRQLPPPNGPVTASPSRQDVARTTLSGGTVVIGRLKAKKSYSLPYEFLDATSADTLLGFYNRLYGVGPFVLVDPSVRNVLGLDVSSMGVRSNASIGWVADQGTLSRDTIAPPAGAADSGVLKWATSGTTNATLAPGTTAGAADIASAPVYLPNEAVTVSLYVIASASSTVTLKLNGYKADGTRLNQIYGANTPVGSGAWVRLTVSAAAQASALVGCAFVLPEVALGTTPPASLSLAGAQLEYGPTATAWQPGYGSPRVLPPSSPGREVQQTQDIATNHTLTLAEV